MTHLPVRQAENTAEKVKMKRIIGTILATALAVLICIGATACRKNASEVKADDQYLGTSDKNLKIDGMSAFELYGEAYANWLKDDEYLMEETLSFSVGSAISVMGTRAVQTTRKVDGNRIFNQEITKGDGLTANMTAAIRYYFDGKNAYELTNSDYRELDFGDEKFKVKNWGDYSPFKGDFQNKNRLMKERWSIYELSDRASLAKEHDDSVYKANGTYYFTLVFDCSMPALEKYQPDLLSEYTANMEAPVNTFRMENTVINAAVKEIDGKMRFVAWYRTETYSGKARKIMDLTCKETRYNKVTYGAQSVTDEELLNLA